MGSLQSGPVHFLLPYWGGACARLPREIRQAPIKGIHAKYLHNIAGFRSMANVGKCDIPDHFFEIDASGPLGLMSIYPRISLDANGEVRSHDEDHGG